jgi:hypothetical protein
LDYHPQEDLAKVGYRPDMKVENFKEHFKKKVWLHVGNCCIHLGKNSKNLVKLRAIFLHRNPSYAYVSKSYFSG